MIKNAILAERPRRWIAWLSLGPLLTPLTPHIRPYRVMGDSHLPKECIGVFKSKIDGRSKTQLNLTQTFVVLVARVMRYLF